jgi:hypothetical protein
MNRVNSERNKDYYHKVYQICVLPVDVTVNVTNAVYILRMNQDGTTAYLQYVAVSCVTYNRFETKNITNFYVYIYIK